MNIVYRGPSIDASYQVSVHLVTIPVRGVVLTVMEIVPLYLELITIRLVDHAMVDSVTM
jgi:hypothetical protein